MVAAPLPDLDTLDLEAAKALLIEQHSRYTAVLTSNSNEIERLVLLVEKLQRMLFGSKSEKVLRQIDQLELQLEELQAASAIEESRAAAEAEHPTQVRPFRRPLPEHLPREVHRHLPGHEACPDCGGRLSELGEDVAEMLEYVRASFKVLRHVRPRLSCDACDRIVQAPAPSRPIDRGLAGPGLLAHVLVSKYADYSVSRRRQRQYCCRRTKQEMRVRPLGGGDQEPPSNHRVLLSLRAMVVSDAERAGLDPVRCASGRRA